MFFFCFFLGGGAPGTCFAVEEMLLQGVLFPKFCFLLQLVLTDFSKFTKIDIGVCIVYITIKRRALFLRPCECRPERSQIYRQPTSTVVLSEIRMQRILSNTRQCILGIARQCILGNTRQYKAMQCNAMLTTQ